MAISGNPRKSLPKGIRVRNTRQHGAFVVTRGGIYPSNPDTAITPIEKGGITYSRQGARIHLPLGGLAALSPILITPTTTTTTTSTKGTAPVSTTVTTAALTPTRTATLPTREPVYTAPTAPTRQPEALTPPPALLPPAPVEEPYVPSVIQSSQTESDAELTASVNAALQAEQRREGMAMRPGRQRPSTDTQEYYEEEDAAAVAPAGMSRNTKIAIGGGAVLGLGLLWKAFAR